MPMLSVFASAIPQHIADRLSFYLNGALICLAGGLVLLIAAVIVLKVHNRRADR